MRHNADGCVGCGKQQANIFFPAIAELQNDLHATQAEIALSISLYILTQGALGQQQRAGRDCRGTMGG